MKFRYRPDVDNKILIALQFWGGDRASAIKLAGFLADLEPTHSQLADLLLVSRFDCEPLPELLIREKLARKFNTYSHRSKSRVTGWPAGCNGTWTATMEWAYHKISAKQCPQYKAIFCCEADGGPVFQNWIERLSNTWDSLPRVIIAGAMVGVRGGPLLEHINGNALITGDLSALSKIVTKARACGATAGWDYSLADWFRSEGWADVPGIRSYYNSPHFTLKQYRQMQTDGLIWCHGDKSNCLVDYGRKVLLGQKR